MDNSSEEKILKLIKFAPVVFILLVFFLVVLFLYLDGSKTYEDSKKSIETNYINTNKTYIQDEINRLYFYIKFLKQNTENELKKDIKSRVYEAHAIATNIYETYKNEKSKEEIFKLIAAALDKIRYNEGRGYFYIDDIYGNKIMLPLDKENEGKNFFEHLDARAYPFVKSIVQTIKDKSERYDEYYWENPITKKDSRKIAFYKYFQPLDVAIGTGEYVEDFEKMVQRKALDYINLIKTNNLGYIFVLEENGTFLLHEDENLIGVNSLNEQNFSKEWKHTISSLIDIGKNGQGFFTYKQAYDNERVKTSYVKGVEKWNWIIGTGFYEDEIFPQIEALKKSIDDKYTNYLITITIILTFTAFILLIISRYVSKYLEKKFVHYKYELEQNQSMLYQKTKMESMGEMIGNIAHQWRQPLSVITTSSSGMKLQKELGVLNDEIFFDSILKINSSANHLSKTIDDFKDFFKPNREKSKFDIKDSFKKAFELVSSQFNKQDINIIQNIQNNIFLESYENQLVQALINILNNSRDELIKQKDDKYIFIDVLKNSYGVEISIKDNAGGIKVESIDKIFEPYFTTKDKSDGTGIGLYMTKNIVEKQLNGTIKVENVNFEYENKEFRGANFIINLKD